MPCSAAEDESAVADGVECDAGQFVLARVHQDQAAARSCGKCVSHSVRTGRAGRIWAQIAVSSRPLTSFSQVPCGALFEDDLVDRSAVVVIVEVELGPAAPGQLDWQLQYPVFRTVQFGQGFHNLVGPDLGKAELCRAMP